MSKSIEQRPPQVTFAAGVVIAGSVMALITAWDRISNLRSLDSRNAAEEFITDGAGQGWGLDVDGVLSLLHVSGVVAAVCAVATGILGWYVLKGDKASRLALAIIAVPLFVSGMATGGLAASFVGAAAVMLWLAPASEWFATGRWTPPPSPEELRAEERKLERETTFSPPPSSPTTEPGPTTDGPRPTGPGPAATPYASAQPYAAPTNHATPQQVSPGQRPGAVVTAFVITAVATFVVAMTSLMAMLVVAMAPDLVMEQVAMQPGGEDVTLAQARFSTYVSGGALLFMCAVGFFFAVFGLRRLEWARRGWMVAAGLSAFGCVLMIASAPGAGLIALLPGIAAVVTLAILRRTEVRRWFATGRLMG